MGCNHSFSRTLSGHLIFYPYHLIFLVLYNKTHPPDLDLIIQVKLMNDQCDAEVDTSSKNF